jgi:hypothetical protein
MVIQIKLWNFNDLDSNILYEEGQNKDAFGKKNCCGLLFRNSFRIIDDGKVEEVNINSISLMTSVGEEKLWTSFNLY